MHLKPFVSEMTHCIEYFLGIYNLYILVRTFALKFAKLKRIAD